MSEDYYTSDQDRRDYEDSGRASTHRQRAAMYKTAIENGELEDDHGPGCDGPLNCTCGIVGEPK